MKAAANAQLGNYIDIALREILNNWSVSDIQRVDSANELFRATEPIMMARLGFTGLTQGAYSVCCTPQLAGALTNEMVGEMCEASPELARQTLGELVNVLTGSLLVACYGEDVAFQLHVSDTVEIPSLPRLHDGEVQLNYRVMGQPMVVMFLRTLKTVENV